MTPVATVVVLTLQSAETIESVLDAVVGQRHGAFEILLIDSGSTDGTLELAARYPCRVVSIDPRDFGHGRTRNYAATLAHGDFVAFLTHDSVPEHDTWLSEMLRPFEDPNVAGTYGRQVPRKEENYLDRSFQATLYGTETVEWNASNWHQGDNLFSDANSAVRKSVLIENPYEPHIIVSEDYEWNTSS